MVEAIKMPKLGQTDDEAHIDTWLVSEGDTVEMGQELLTVTTDKAQVDVESVADGVVLKIVVGADQTVDVGTVIAYVGEEGAAVPD